MLSAFTAHPIIELRQRDKSKIETILAYGMFSENPIVRFCACIGCMLTW